MVIDPTCIYQREAEMDALLFLERKSSEYDVLEGMLVNICLVIKPIFEQ